jgi:hypothetical protein
VFFLNVHTIIIILIYSHLIALKHQYWYLGLVWERRSNLKVGSKSVLSIFFKLLTFSWWLWDPGTQVRDDFWMREC